MESTMIDHVGFSVSDYARAKAFYEKALAPLGYALVMEATAQETGQPAAGFGSGGKPDFWIGGEGKLEKAVHIAIVAKDRPTVDAFYRAALAAGGRDNGAPGTIIRIITVLLYSIPMDTISRRSVTRRLSVAGAKQRPAVVGFRFAHCGLRDASRPDREQSRWIP
jgi:catechol 2,3-dioxygenase-like lactoylglutathione lyase family enzyme